MCVRSHTTTVILCILPFMHLFPHTHTQTFLLLYIVFSPSLPLYPLSFLVPPAFTCSVSPPASALRFPALWPANWERRECGMPHCSCYSCCCSHRLCYTLQGHTRPYCSVPALGKYVATLMKSTKSCVLVSGCCSCYSCCSCCCCILKFTHSTRISKRQNAFIC